jgi:hypothetical protein
VALICSHFGLWMANCKSLSISGFARLLGWAMRDLVVLFLHLLTTLARLAGPGGARAVLAESVLAKQQLLILNRSRKRSPNLRPSDRIVAALCALLMRPSAEQGRTDPSRDRCAGRWTRRGYPAGRRIASPVRTAGGLTQTAISHPPARIAARRNSRRSHPKTVNDCSRLRK